ncbi:MAG TPA: hypothetical protein VHQ65_01130 [Thermoanaerobaculia bacterium]|nr:hypothetical protein [Thermoanaerobaculia bacterium]
MKRTNAFRFPPAALLIILLLAATGWACSPGGEGGDGGVAGPAAEPIRVESPELGLALAIPADSGAEVEETGGEAIRVALPAGDELPAGGTVAYAADPPQSAGINLVEAVNQRVQEVEARPEGDFLGQVELGGPLGPAYSTRARFTEEGQQVEEIRIFTVHPAGNRLLHMTYRYTPVPGVGKQRMDQALEAFGWIEPVAVGGEEEETGGGDAAAGDAASAP